MAMDRGEAPRHGSRTSGAQFLLMKAKDATDSGVMNAQAVGSYQTRQACDQAANLKNTSSSKGHYYCIGS